MAHAKVVRWAKCEKFYDRRIMNIGSRFKLSLLRGNSLIELMHVIVIFSERWVGRSCHIDLKGLGMGHPQGRRNLN